MTTCACPCANETNGGEHRNFLYVYPRACIKVIAPKLQTRRSGEQARCGARLFIVCAAFSTGASLRHRRAATATGPGQ